MTSTVRLALALTTSGFVLAATAGGSWPLSWSAVLWAVPALVAMRSLPLPLGLAVTVVAGAAGRAVAFWGASGSDAATLGLVAAAALVPALLVDRFVLTWLPRAGHLAWPCGVVLVERACADTRVAALLAPPPHLEAVAFVGADLGVAGATVAVALMAQAFASLAGVLNRKTHDPYGQKERERGVRWSSIAGFAFGAVLLIAGAVRARVSGAPAATTSAGDVVVVACAAGLVALGAVAARTWWRGRSVPVIAPGGAPP